MKWQEIKALVTALLESFALPFLQENEPELKPIPIRVERPEDRR